MITEQVRRDQYGNPKVYAMGKDVAEGWLYWKPGTIATVAVVGVGVLGYMALRKRRKRRR